MAVIETIPVFLHDWSSPEGEVSSRGAKHQELLPDLTH